MRHASGSRNHANLLAKDSRLPSRTLAVILTYSQLLPLPRGAIAMTAAWRIRFTWVFAVLFGFVSAMGEGLHLLPGQGHDPCCDCDDDCGFSAATCLSPWAIHVGRAFHGRQFGSGRPNAAAVEPARSANSLARHSASPNTRSFSIGNFSRGSPGGTRNQARLPLGTSSVPVSCAAAAQLASSARSAACLVLIDRLICDSIGFAAAPAGPWRNAASCWRLNLGFRAAMCLHRLAHVEFEA